jgi:Mg/Co/Ni transporter MgtE
VEISYEAVRKRRRKDPHLDAACNAAIAACRSRAPEFLASAMVATFDPETLPDPETNPLPKVTIAEAIRIAQLRDTTAQGNAQQPMQADALEELRERVVRKFLKLRKRRMQDNIEQGWSYDESHDQTIPPGWIRENPAK